MKKDNFEYISIDSLTFLKKRPRKSIKSNKVATGNKDIFRFTPENVPKRHLSHKQNLKNDKIINILKKILSTPE